MLSLMEGAPRSACSFAAIGPFLCCQAKGWLFFGPAIPLVAGIWSYSSCTTLTGRTTGAIEALMSIAAYLALFDYWLFGSY